METEKDLMEYLKKKDHIFIYGAGINAKRLSKRMVKYKIYPEGYIVTKKKDNPSYINERKVWEAKELSEYKTSINQMSIVIAIAGNNQELLEELIDLGYKNILLLLPDILLEMRDREWVEAYNQQQSAFKLDYDYPYMEKGHIAIIEEKTGRALFRTRWSSIAEVMLKEKCSLKAFEQSYGSYCKLPGLKDDTAKISIKGMEIYNVTSHLNKKKETTLGKKEWEISIQAGAALTTERMGYLTDDTGDHISEENRNYCECTALYWIWKNTFGQDYVGLCQYRRRFRMEKSDIQFMKKQNIDVVAVIPQFNHCTNKEFFSKYGFRHDWRYWKDAVINYDISYEDVIDQYEQMHFFIPCNMAIFKRVWFDKYCEFAFSVASMIDRKYKEALVMPREDRYMGYLFENLLSIFLIYHHDHMRIAYTDMVFI
ncbi:MAG: DUF4422 domain-containing protein [Lachnospiraceae bacterium]|nr:DUF4422 domain-containing protein [Lachnospiraceae bacterium]